jgi:hypothetical protein
MFQGLLILWHEAPQLLSHNLHHLHHCFLCFFPLYCLNYRFVSDFVLIIFIDPVFRDHLFGIFASWQLLDQTYYGLSLTVFCHAALRFSLTQFFPGFMQTFQMIVEAMI